MFVKFVLSYVQFNNWFFTCINLFVVSFHVKYWSEYDIGSFTRFYFIVCLWNDCYPISTSLIDSLLALICMLFLFIWFIAAGSFVADFTRSNISVCLWNVYIVYQLHWLFFYLLRSECRFLIFPFFSYYVLSLLTRSDDFVWLWNIYYCRSSLLIDYLLAQTCMLFLFIRIIVTGNVFGYLTRSDYYVN